MTPKILHAINHASMLHSEQTRRGSNMPYISHPYAVAFILARYVEDEDIIVAGLLHDTLEDVSGCTYADLKELYGARVVEIVAELTEEIDLDPREGESLWRAVKERQMGRLEYAREEVLFVTAADKMHNLICTIKDYEDKGDEVWERFYAGCEDQMWMYAQVISILTRRLEHSIVDDLLQTYVQAREVFGLVQD